MNLEEMKQQLNNLNRRMDSLEERNSSLIKRIESGRINSAQQRLVKQYRIFSCIGMSMSFVFIILYKELLPFPTRVCAAIYFLTAAIMDSYLANGIKSIDYNTMGVATVAKKAIYYRKRHHIFMGILIAMCIPLIASFFFAMGTDEYMVYSMIAGVVIGLAIGIKLYLDIMKNYRDLTLNDN
ncbi:MAG: hypothetical protein K2G47_05150 [Muribaculum sp.]|nr:hypothetical protein [Muribaculum sp.]